MTYIKNFTDFYKYIKLCKSKNRPWDGDYIVRELDSVLPESEYATYINSQFDKQSKPQRNQKLMQQNSCYRFGKKNCKQNCLHNYCKMQVQKYNSQSWSGHIDSRYRHKDYNKIKHCNSKYTQKINNNENNSTGPCYYEQQGSEGAF